MQNDVPCNVISGINVCCAYIYVLIMKLVCELAYILDVAYI